VILSNLGKKVAKPAYQEREREMDIWRGGEGGAGGEPGRIAVTMSDDERRCRHKRVWGGRGEGKEGERGGEGRGGGR
jgi:hypothetical protein